MPCWGAQLVQGLYPFAALKMILFKYISHPHHCVEALLFFEGLS